MTSDTPTIPHKPILKPPSTLLMGPTGVGKTWSVHTLLKAGLKVVCIFTEPSGEESVMNACHENDVPIDNLHFSYCPFASTSWDVFEDMLDSVRRMDYDALSKLKMGPGKGKYTQLITLYQTLADFTCQRTGKKLGPVDELGDDYALVFDSISGLNQLCMDLVIGAKPTAHQGEWGVAMNVERRIVNKFTSDLKCFFVAIAHVSRERDEVSGRNIVGPMFLGSKLAPEMPKMFSDVVLARREGSKFYWSTTDGEAEHLKARNLPLSSTIEPSFIPIVEAYRRRMKQAEGRTETETETA